MIADRGATERDDEVGPRRTGAGDGVAQGGEIVGDDAEIDRLGPGLRGEGGERQPVRSDDLVPGRRLARPHQFVAGGDDGDARAAAQG